jgi:hypothetical protein
MFTVGIVGGLTNYTMQLRQQCSALISDALGQTTLRKGKKPKHVIPKHGTPRGQYDENDEDVEFSDINIAMKFVIHLVGDLGQPLHVSGRDRGGTRTNLVFDGSKRTMHWSTFLLLMV